MHCAPNATRSIDEKTDLHSTNSHDGHRATSSFWTATQKPSATKEDLEHYLSFLVEDVGHQHLPYDSDDSRHPDGKQSIREGMTHYLGKHIEYEAELMNISYGLNAVAIQFHVSAKGKRGPDHPIESMSYNTMEVLEIESGKVSLIRKYN